MVESDYSVVHRDDAPVVSMADVDEVPEEFDPLTVRNVDEALQTEELTVKVWTVPPGAHMGVHGHERQEECYYVLRGTFEVEVGPPGDTETVEAGPGTFFAASPEVARGYENVDDEIGTVLVVSAPKVEDRGIPEAEME